MFRYRLTLERRRNMAGYLFVAPLIVGIILFFAYPIIQSVIFSLSKLTVTKSGYELTYVGVQNYREALLVNPTFPRVLTSTMAQTLSSIPAILVFSFLAASILNQRFRGRFAARLIFFLPVILTSGAVQMLAAEDYMHQLASGEAVQAQDALLGGASAFLMRMKLPTALLTYVSQAVAKIPSIISASGIPILIMLAALQSIPRPLYEAADIEGATAWESFWTITFPLISPMLLANFIYVTVDTFTSATNQVVDFILRGTWGTLGFGLSTAMAWIYFALVAVVLVVVMGIFSRRVFYHE